MKKILGLVLFLGFWGSVQAATVEVSMENLAFRPQILDIKQGDTVRWVNQDNTPHLVQGNFASSPNLNTGESYEFTFNEAGNFDYICQYHPSMSGTVRVALSAEIAPPSDSGALGTNDLFADFFETAPVPSQLEDESNVLEIEIPNTVSQPINEIQTPEIDNNPPLIEVNNQLDGQNQVSSVNNNAPLTVITPPSGNEGGEFQSAAEAEQSQSLAASGPAGFNWLWVLAAVFVMGGYFCLVRR